MFVIWFDDVIIDLFFIIFFSAWCYWYTASSRGYKNCCWNKAYPCCIYITLYTQCHIPRETVSFVFLNICINSSLISLSASYSQKMLIYDALDGRFLTIKLRPRQSCCSVCGDNPTINKLQDYELFCGASATDKVIRRKKLTINVQPPLTSDDLSNLCKVTPLLLQQYVALQ